MGLAPITNETKAGKAGIMKIIFYSLPPIVSVLVTLVIFQYTFFPDLSYGHIAMILFNAYFLMVTISNIVATIQCLVHKSEYFSMVQRINDISDSLAFRCERDVNYRKFVESFRIKFIIMSLNWIAMGIGSYVIHLDEISEFIFTTATLMLEIVFSMSCMHAILFIDHVGLFTKETNEAFIAMSFSSSNLSQITVQNLVEIKSLHFEIWNLVRSINKYFGWSFVTLFTKYLVDITYSLYWSFLNFEAFGWNTVLHLGGYVPWYVPE